MGVGVWRGPRGGGMGLSCTDGWENGVLTDTIGEGKDGVDCLASVLLMDGRDGVGSSRDCWIDQL